MHEPASPERAVPAPRLELRIEQGRARVGLSATPLGDGLSLVDLEMEVAGTPVPVDPGAGTAQLRSFPCALVRLEVASDSPDEVALPGAGELADLVARALGPLGWPTPELSGLIHGAIREGHRARATWQRPGAEARTQLERAGAARSRGEPDAALRLALAGQAALAAGLPVEGEAALRSALALGLDPDEARDAWGALAALAREHGDVAGERGALAGLARAAPTGERSALLLRLAQLAVDAGDLDAARAHAEEARTLAPRDRGATEACLALARQAGDGAAVIDLLDRLASLDPAAAGEHQLDRARLLATAGRLQEADAAFREALARLPPLRALSDEHAALRRGAPPPVGRLPWSEPLEAFAARVAEPGEAARALRDASEVATRQGDRGAALRAARRAHERATDVSFAGEVLAGLLHAGGSVREALDLHRALLGAGQPPLEPESEADRLVSLAELSEESGDRAGATAALDRLLDLRPHDAEAMSWRFRLDLDRARAVARLAEDAGRLRSRRRQADLLLRAAAAAQGELGDAGRAAELVGRARDAARGLPPAEVAVARAEVALARASGEDSATPVAAERLASALLGLGDALDAAGDPEGSAAARDEAADLAVRAGLPALAALALDAVEAEAVRRGDARRAAVVARRAARALLDAGDGAGAETRLRRAVARDPGEAAAWDDLEALAFARGDAGAPVLAEVLSARAARAEGAARAGHLVALARVRRGALQDDEGALAALRDALEACPGDPSAESERDRLLAATGRLADLGQAILARADREADPGERARLRLRAAEVLADGDDAARALAVPALLAILTEPPPSRSTLLEAAARLAALGRGAEAAPHLVALCRTDPHDGAAARALGKALAEAPAERARAFREIAADAPPGPVRAGHLREAAAAHAEAGDAAGVREAGLAAFETWPVDELSFRGALADASGDVAATDAILALRAAAVPAEAAACHGSRAELLLSAGRSADAVRAFEQALAAGGAEPGAHVGLAQARAGAGDLPGALAAARAGAALATSQERRADRRAALETGAQLAAAAGDRGEDAAAILEELALLLLAERPPGDPEVTHVATRAAAALGQAGQDARASSLLARVAEGEAAGVAAGPVPLEAGVAGAEDSGPSVADLLRPLLASVRSLADAGELEAAYARLKLAREIDPEHLELTLGLARVAEKLGRVDEAVSLGEAWADAVAPTDAAAAAARYRELADTAHLRLSDAGRAAALLEKAVALEPEDAATGAALASLRASRRGEALALLEDGLARLRAQPADVRAARAVALLSREIGAGEGSGRERAARAARAAAADALARFGQRLGPAATPPELASRVDAGVRERVALPGADGPTAQLLSLLAPYLEPLFPVDLARHGVGPADRLSPAAAGPFQAALETASGALGGRPLALFAGRRPGLHAALENTRPPSLVLAPDVASLAPGAMAFLAARSLALASSGWALVGKFAPRDTLILCELSARFAGGEPAPRGLPLDRAGAFLAALERTVPPSMRDRVGALGPASADELSHLDPAGFATALERTANRLALVHAGDLHGALSVLGRLPRSGAALPADPVAALARPDLADLAGFALSDLFLELRGMLLGWS